MSVPLATNVGKAPARVVESASFSFDGQNLGAPAQPLDIKKSDLGKPQPMVRAAQGAIPKGQGTRAVITFDTNAQVRKVFDGDSLAYSPTGKDRLPQSGALGQCRVELIDAPETGHGDKRPAQPYGAEAGRLLQQMVENRQVNITVSGTDSRGRDICQIEIEGKNVNLELVKAGAAWFYERYGSKDARAAEFRSAQDNAKKNKSGLWAEKDPVNPETWRRSRWSN